METSYTDLSTKSWTKTLSSQARITACTVTYSTTYTVTYDCNGGTSGCPSNVTSIAPSSEIYLAAAPSKTGHAFDGWSDGTSTYAAGAEYTVNNDVTMTAQWTAYTITAQSNNDSYGTVSLNGFTITASPASGCRYASPAYSVSPANSATVAQNGNTFTVTPTANTTVTINFEEIPTHAATFSVNGATTSTQEVAEGAAITFPADPADIDGKTFVGWTTVAIYGTTDEAPTMVNSATMGNSDVIFYAVFATVVDGGSASYTLDYNQEQGLSSATLGYGSPVEYTATDGSTWIVKAHKNAGMQINTGKNSSIKVPDCPGNIMSIAITCSANKAVGFSENDYNGSGTITYLAFGTDATSQTLDLTGKSAMSGYIVPKSGSTSITKIVVNYASVSISGYCTKVAAATDPTIVIVPSTVDATAAANQGILNVTYNNIDSENGVEIHWFDAAGQRVQEGYDWVSATLDGNWNVNYSINANSGAARTAYLKIYGLDEEANDVYSNLVTISQAEYVAPSSWVLTDLADLTPADVFVIVGYDGDSYALPNDGGTSTPSAIAIEIDDENEKLSAAPADNLKWNLVGNATDGYTFYPAGTASTYLYCGTTQESGSNDNIRVGTGNTGRNVFKLETKDLLGASYDYLVTNDDYVDRYVCLYNSSSWRGYVEGSISSNNKNITHTTFYKKVTDPVTYTKNDIAAYVGEKDNYYLIASPVASVTPSASNGFLTNDYDLYYFDDAQNEEWINHEAGAFNLVSGKGYLYANNGENVTLTFTGAPYFGNGLVPLQYTEGAEFAGWNLIGNPFNTNATLNMPYYRLNADGFSLITTTENKAVNVMEGVFVRATAANTEAVFTQASSGAKSISQLNLKVTRNRGNVVDNAIIRFDEGATLSKFQLNPNHTKVYFQQDGKDFAVVRSDSEGEMPVSFKAAENGTYTFSVNVENVEMNYLHLIDNLTGADIDLLATPSYSFEANTRDYANRFKLVFKANTGVEENTATETFAYFNGSEWVINNNGNATLQVIDMMGRVVSSEQINGNTAVNINQAAGVYMLRLVNKDNVKVQKVVVK